MGLLMTSLSVNVHAHCDHARACSSPEQKALVFVSTQEHMPAQQMLALVITSIRQCTDKILRLRFEVAKNECFNETAMYTLPALSGDAHIGSTCQQRLPCIDRRVSWH